MKREQQSLEPGLWKDSTLVHDAASAALAITASPNRIRVADALTLRLLALPTDPLVRVRELRLRLDHWESPRRLWRGSAAPIAGLVQLSISYDTEAKTAEAHVVLGGRAPLADIISALLPAFVPLAKLSGAGLPRVVIDASAPTSVLALHPGRPRRAQAFPGTLHGFHLRDGDLALVGVAQPEPAAEPEEIDDAEPVEDPIATEFLTVSSDGRVGPAMAVPRQPLIAIDLTVHNPVGRMPGWHKSPRSGVPTVSTEGGMLTVRGPRGGRILTAPLAAPLSPATIRSVQPWENASLAGLATSTEETPEQEVLLKRRLTELAATGLILHDLPDGTLHDDGLVHPDLLRYFALPFTSGSDDREPRSVGQRRLAMKEHAGFFELASRAQELTGHQLLPRVSAIVSSIRPTRLVEVLRMFAAQSYPHLEVIAIAHGVPAPDLAPYADELAGLDLKVLEVDGTVPFGSALAEGVRASSGDLVTKVDDDDWYSEEHIWDLVLAHLYSGADVVGKTTEYLYFESIDHTVRRTFATETYHEQVAGGAMLMSREALHHIGGWRPTPNSTDRSILVGVHEAGGIGYRTHGLGYLYVRHNESHTWAVAESKLILNTYQQWRGMHLPEEPALAHGFQLVR